MIKQRAKSNNSNVEYFLRKKRTTSAWIVISLLILILNTVIISFTEGFSLNTGKREIPLKKNNPSEWLFHLNKNDINDVNELKIGENVDALLSSTAPQARRPFLGAIGMTLGLLTSSQANAASVSGLQWESSPVNKRTGVTVFQAENFGYNVNFVTYLSRFLLSFDNDCQKWWYARAVDIPRSSSADEVSYVRTKQFAAFSASVEVGLQEYSGSDGPGRLLDSLLSRYCPPESELSRALSGAALQFKLREIKEARRQIALLFGLMEKNQPVDDITTLLRKIDNATVTSITINDPGMGYAPGYGSPKVTFPEPVDGGRRAKGRASLRPNGRILRVDLINRGSGYSEPPKITFTPPKGLNHNVTSSQPVAKSVLVKGVKSAMSKGSIERIELQEPGSGYHSTDNIQVHISAPSSPNGTQATAKAILEYEIASVDVIDGGYGYAIEQLIDVTIEPPPVTARVNLNDPLVVERLRSENLLPTQSFSTEVGGGNCIGRACYDTSPKVTAYAKSERDSYYSFRDDKEQRKLKEKEAELANRAVNGNKYVSATTGNFDYTFSPIWDKSSSSAQLLQLIPEGFGLVYNNNLKRYTLVQAKGYEIISSLRGTSYKPIDPAFGPRGRSPIEKEKALQLDSILRFAASGALCCSAAHLSLTPIDVVKTKIQTQPEIYNKGIIGSFKDVWNNEGPSTFFDGWQPTFVGYLTWGGVTYSLTEIFRRLISEFLRSYTMGGNAFLDAVTSVSSDQLDVTIIFIAAGLGASVGCFFICPFEAVRIRSVAQPDFAGSTVGVLNRMVKEEGTFSLFSAVPAFLLKEVPFACAKFAVFSYATTQLYEMFPAAREDIKLSLLVSVAGGLFGGLFGAIVSNPADATISQMKKGKSDIGPVDAAKELLEDGGVRGLFKGLGLRSWFYPILVSFQFLVYDSVRIALGVGTDDMKLYLNVLSNLKDSLGPL